MADEKNDEQQSGGLKSLVDELPLDQLKEDLQDALGALGDKAKETVMQRLSDATDSLNDMAQNGGVVSKAAGKGAKAAAEGESPVKGALKGGLGGVKDKVKSAMPGGGGGGGGGSKPTKSTNIIEEIDIGAPVDVVYNQWTQFQDFAGFMKKVENAEQEEEKVTFKAQVFWSHRTWEATILEQVPNERIIWRSEGEKGHVDGAVTFHELAPNMTRVLVVLEYYPQGFMERTGNIWRAQGRRARLELKHFRRHVMTRALLEQDELEGWRGEIRDSEIVRDHDEVVEEEEREQDEGPEDEYEGEEEEAPEDEYEEEGEEEEAPEDEYDEEEPEDEYEEEGEEEEAPEDEYDEEEEAPEDEYDEEEPEDEYEESEDEGAEEEPEDEDEVEDEEPEEKPRRRSSAKKTSSRKRR
jgi:hypothetical protein